MLIKRRIAIAIIVGCMAAVLMLCGYAVWREQHSVPPYEGRVATEQPTTDAGQSAQPEPSAAEPAAAAEPSDGKASTLEAPDPGATAQTAQPQGNSATAQTAQPQGSGETAQTAQPQGNAQTAQNPQPQGSGETAQTAQPSQNPTQSASQTPASSKRNEIVSAYRERMVALAESYYAKIEAVAQGARDEFHALPKEEQTEQNKERIVSERMERLQTLESYCDREIASALRDLTAELRAIGEDTEVVEELRAEYDSSKIELQNRYMEKFRGTGGTSASSQ